MTKEPYVSFSVRNGFKPPPPQLMPNEVSHDLRNLLLFALQNEIMRARKAGGATTYFSPDWKRLTLEFQARVVRQPPSEQGWSPTEFSEKLKRVCVQASIGALFDVVEFFLLQDCCSRQMKDDIARAFVDSRAAYRVVDGMICAIGTEQQAEAFMRAIDATATAGAAGARTHLLNAGKELKNGKWAASLRESIHPVEAVAVMLAPDAGTLGAALKVLEKRGHLHGSLKSAFSSLYGYASDEEGVRHANVFKGAPNVDEADALFMLGACASFVSYVLARSASSHEPVTD